MNRPQPEEFSAAYQARYINTVSSDVIGELEEQASSIPALIRSLPEEKGDYAYAEGKWTIKTMFGHLIDTERIMIYRALRIARNDKTPLPGFEENYFADSSHYYDRSLESLALEFELLRQANMFLIRSFTDEELSRTGTSSGWTVSVRALVFIVAGHVNHHRAILLERYLGE